MTMTFCFDFTSPNNEPACGVNSTASFFSTSDVMIGKTHFDEVCNMQIISLLQDTDRSNLGSAKARICCPTHW